MTTTQLLVTFLATLAQFLSGAIWYTPLFGKLWGKIHGFDKLDKKSQQKMMSQMGPIFATQIGMTIITSIVMIMFATVLQNVSLYMLTFWIWLGFVVPAHVSGVLFGGTQSKWIVTKSAVLAGGSFVSLMIGAAVVTSLI